LTAEVKFVTAAGNLIIEGSRKIVINKDTQLFKLTGLVRRDDILPDNSVLSEKLAQAEIRLEGKGQIADRQRKGLLTQVLDWLF
jgi:flagellar L-ring protein precursor FlgH